MGNMRFKVGDRVRIKSLKWYNKNKDKNGNIVFSSKVPHFALCVNVRTVFTKDMVKYCGKVVTIENVWTANYSIVEGTHRDYFTDEMIEGLVKEETSIDLTIKGEEVKERIEIMIPEGYEYVIESGKIIFTKKKKEYPKTYEECCKILGFLNVDLCFNADYRSFYASKEQWKRLGLMNQFYQLLICRDAYWKIAGEEMGLGEPWEPDWNNVSDKYCIYFVSGDVWSKECQTRQCPFAFPTEEMRDAFYENFKELIESVKELL